MDPSEQLTQRAALSAGQRLGNFQIVSLLGTGGMGEVYRARDLRLHRDVAIKTLPQSLARDPDRLARLEHEAQAASELNHPNIVSVYDVGQQDSTTWIVSELVEGSSLRQALSKGPFPLRRVLEIAIQIGDGLAAAHAAGLVHLDLKPENIMLTRTSRVKILDFGLAKHRIRNTGGEESSSVVTDAQIIKGTPAYMSPEQIGGQEFDQRSDIFSLGVVVYEMLAGRRPFAGETPLAVMNAVLYGEPAELPDKTPSALSKLLRHCLEKEPAQRMQSASDFSFALRILAQEPLPFLAPPKKRRRLAISLALAAAALSLSAGTFWLGRQSMPLQPYSNGTLRRLTWDSGLTTDGAISPDGKFVAYASDRGNQSNLDIYVQQIDSGGIVKITQDPADDSDPTFSPDSSRLAFRSERAPAGIYEESVLGGEARLVVPDGERPRFSPDGLYLMYAHGISNFSALFVQSVTGGAPVEISRGCGWVNRAAVWSPDSAHVLFGGTCEGRSSFWLASIDGKAPVEVKRSFDFWRSQDLVSEGTTLTLDDWLDKPSRLLVPLREYDASFQALIPIKADGTLFGPVQRLTFGPTKSDGASGSENGRVVLSTFRQSSNIWKLNVDASGRALGLPVRMTSGSAESVMPALSRDGSKLAFAMRQSGRWALSLFDLKLGAQRIAAWEPQSLRYPVFDADADRLVFSSSPDAKKITISGGMPETLPLNNVTDWSPQGDLLAQPGDFHSVNIVHGPTYKPTPFLSDTESVMYQAHLSWDGRWVTFNSVRNGRSRIFLAPFRRGLVPKSEWIPITEGEAWNDKPRFSSDGQFIFFTSDRDGYRCLWEQQLTPDMHPRGNAAALYHIHSSRRQLDGATGGGLELATAPGLVVFNQGERTGNIWVLEPR